MIPDIYFSKKNKNQAKQKNSILFQLPIINPVYDDQYMTK
jgi:hypothetical protein